jgi:FkbM family methyltransferase
MHSNKREWPDGGHQPLVSNPNHPPFFLRMGRATRHLPLFKGLSMLVRLYRYILPNGPRFRVEDFDGDLKLDVNVTETMGINIWHTPKLFEKAERQLFCAEIKPGTVVLDVGANIGIYTLLAAKRGARVFAIEPDPKNMQCLRHHLKINGLEDRVTLLEMAATARPGRVRLYQTPINSGATTLFGHGEYVEIEGRTIDSLELPAIDICKMDIEGAEYVALSGMKRTLERSPTMKLLVEYSAHFPDTRQLLSLLRAEFRSVRIVDGAELSPFDSAPPYCNLWATH